ncbi:MAG: hypothetical protein ACE5KR_01560 [Candidatus Bipolaricaulia bacterium]
MRPNWGVLGIAIVAITLIYFLFSYSLWELLPLYRRLRRRGIEAELEGLEPGEHLLEEALLTNDEGKLVWLGLTDRRLLALRHGPRPLRKAEILEEIALEEIGELRERVLPPSLGMVLDGAGLGGLGALLTWKAGDLWVLLLVLGVLVLAGGLIRIRYYDLFQADKLLPFWSFNSQGPGRFRARRFARSLKRQLTRGS